MEKMESISSLIDRAKPRVQMTTIRQTKLTRCTKSSLTLSGIVTNPINQLQTKQASPLTSLSQATKPICHPFSRSLSPSSPLSTKRNCSTSPATTNSTTSSILSSTTTGANLQCAEMTLAMTMMNFLEWVASQPRKAILYKTSLSGEI